MNIKSVIFLALVVLTHCSHAQQKNISSFKGRWINIQLDYFKNQLQNDSMAYRISPWFITIGDDGKCVIDYLFEQHAVIGYPIPGTKWQEEGVLHFKNTWIYKIDNNDSLIIYNTNNTPPGSGVIFKRYRK